jgi:hypothetical protein
MAAFITPLEFTSQAQEGLSFGPERIAPRSQESTDEGTW